MSSLILTGVTESDRFTVREITGIYAPQVGGAYVCYFSNNVALLTHIHLLPCCDPWILNALITLHVIVNNQSL